MFEVLLLPALLLRPDPAPRTTLTVKAGQRATLTVLYTAEQALLNREAPNLLTLVTPWGSFKLKPGGQPQHNPAYRDYFAQVSPMHFNFRVPSTAKAGQYSAKLSTTLFVCQQNEKICAQRDLSFPVGLRVNAGGTGRAVFKLQDADFQSSRLKLP